MFQHVSAAVLSASLEHARGAHLEQIGYILRAGEMCSKCIKKNRKTICVLSNYMSCTKSTGYFGGIHYFFGAHGRPGSSFRKWFETFIYNVSLKKARHPGSETCVVKTCNDAVSYLLIHYNIYIYVYLYTDDHFQWEKTPTFLDEHSIFF